MSINVPPDMNARAGNGMEVAGEGLLRPANMSESAVSSVAVPAISTDTGDTGGIPAAALEPQGGTGEGTDMGGIPAAALEPLVGTGAGGQDIGVVPATTLPPTTQLPSQAPAGLEPGAGGQDIGAVPAVQATTLPPTTPLPSPSPSSSSPSSSIPPGFIAGTNGGLVPLGDGFGVGVPVAFTGEAWTRLQSVSFVAVVGGPQQEGGGNTGVGIDEVVYVVEVECT